jgi:dTDP-4-amino-4,6-dideoxygalactose transaminase
MKIPFVDLHAQYLTIKHEIDRAIAEVIADSSYIRGLHVDAFEEAWARALGVKHCVSCANGTDAIYIALRGLGLKPGDEVITSAHSWISTSETITQAGGRVVFCDTDQETFTIDPADIERKITPATVGIIPVHLYGQPADMGAIMAIARKHNLWVIEDCAQAHLARYNGQVVGTFGNVATFSFYPGKNLGAYGDAGCAVTNEDRLADWMATFARHGGKGEHVMEGINSRMDGFQGAILNVKLPHLAAWTKARQRVASNYDQLLEGIGDIDRPEVAAGREHVYHLPFYPAYAHLDHAPADFPVAHANQSRILSLPIYPEMTDEMIACVVERIGDFFLDSEDSLGAVAQLAEDRG